MLVCFSFCLSIFSQKTYPDRLVQSDGFLKRLAAEKGFSGTVLIARDNKILLDQGYGFADLKKTERTKTDTKFYIASITKNFTAVAILKLVEQKKLRLDDAIARFFKEVPADKRSITIHHLLTHTAGLAQNYAADGIADRHDAVKAVLTQPLKSTVGEKFGYGNEDYNLLAAIIEIASGLTYENFFREQLLRPAKMSNTGFWGDKTIKGEPIASTNRPIDPQPNWGFRGGVGMYSTAGDLYKWQQALFADVGRNFLPHR